MNKHKPSVFLHNDLALVYVLNILLL
jgi:hypothetical protein